MLEESKMDKKSTNRSTQIQSRASAIDCKKNSSEVTHKPWPRGNKKREGPGTTNPKNEPYRKNGPTQRGRGLVDRQPRARGSSGYNMGGAQNPGVEDEEEPEIGSVFVPGSKKQNLNHLLNFMYPSRGPERRGHQPQGRRTVQQRASVPQEHDLYLRAYCQFVVKEDGDYKANLMDPDISIKWEQIEEIVVRSTGSSECPICLGPPVAGRVGICGHVYCWPCVLHYAETHDKQPPPCPVCTTPLHVKDMKPTIRVQWESPAEEVIMRLVRRLRGLTNVEVAPPRGEMPDARESNIMPLENLKDSPYAKIFTVNNKQVQEIVERERNEIQNQIMSEIDTSEIVFMEQALKILKQKEENLNCLFRDQMLTETPEDIVPIIYEKQVVNEKKIDWFDVTEEGAAGVDIIQEQISELDINVNKSNLNPDALSFIHNTTNDDKVEDFPLIDYGVQPEEEIFNESPSITDIDKQNQAKYFYFYQAEDGQQVFLNSLNVRILNASWGTLSAAPLLIRGRVLHRETQPLTEQTRKHMPYTAHLPLYCSFDIVEIDLQPPYVTTAALNSFSEDIDRRARLRARHERDERRRERAFRRALEGPPRPDFSSDILFPPTGLSSPVDPPLLSTSLEEVSPSTSAGLPAASGPSFAKMASASGTWRVRKVATEAPPPVVVDEHTAPRTLSLSDAIEAALHATPTSTKKKNKKSKQKVLFTTGMQRTT